MISSLISTPSLWTFWGFNGSAFGQSISYRNALSQEVTTFCSLYSILSKSESIDSHWDSSDDFIEIEIGSEAVVTRG